MKYFQCWGSGYMFAAMTNQPLIDSGNDDGRDWSSHWEVKKGWIISNNHVVEKLVFYFISVS